MKRVSAMAEFLRPCKVSSRMRASWGVNPFSALREDALSRSESKSETTPRGAHNSPLRMADAARLKSFGENWRGRTPRQPSRSILDADAASRVSLSKMARTLLPVPWFVISTKSELGICSMNACRPTTSDTAKLRQRENACSGFSEQRMSESPADLETESLKIFRGSNISPQTTTAC
jgi:hypothetical protein